MTPYHIEKRGLTIEKECVTIHSMFHVFFVLEKQRMERRFHESNRGDCKKVKACNAGWKTYQTDFRQDQRDII